ncbi:MAG: hypothetical protein MJ099_02955 [Clostridia bacterium]|nr:hypothetical protein [Clostridia bacterium]
MAQLKTGFARVNITPPMGINVAGYYAVRLADGVLDELEADVLAIELDGTRVALISVDNCGIPQEKSDAIRKAAAEKNGIPFENVFLASTHTHTGPDIAGFTPIGAIEDDYLAFLTVRVSDAVGFALADLKHSKMGWGVGMAPNISFVRRFRMKDGSIQTNPGVNNPDIVAPIGEVDERVNVLRFDREGADTIVLVNFGDHPDVVGGCKISADWPGFLRRSFEKAIDDTKCIFFNGAQGDVNHVKVHPNPGDFNDMFNDFDDVSRGYGHARYMGRVVAGAVMQVYDKVNYIDVPTLGVLQKTVQVPSNRPAPEDLPKAREYEALHQAGRDDEIPFRGMMLTTVVAEAERMLRLENGPDAFPMQLTVISIGPIAPLRVPGEPVTGIGRALKEANGWTLVLPVCLANGSEGYFPMQEAYDEGGYEARSSPFRAGVAEFIIKEGTEMLESEAKA